MIDSAGYNPIVFTNRARCRDCYRCIRACPVDAIGIHDGQAFVDEDRCISCGTCIRECPQGAKTYRRDLAEVREMLKSGVKAAVSIAPSFAGMYEMWQIRRMPSMLRRLGFQYAAETAVGASLIAEKMKEMNLSAGAKPVLSTACPAMVEYILHYRPEFSELLLPLVSPMIAHARHIKRTLGAETRVVFIGPCVAKKQEALRDREHSVDAVLTFAELEEWFEALGMAAENFEESPFDEEPDKTARIYALEGGGLKTSHLETDLFEANNIPVSGIEAIRDVLESLPRMKGGCVVEPLFCAQGCINGPLMETDRPVFDRRKTILDYFSACPELGRVFVPGETRLDRSFPDPVVTAHPFTEEQIRRVLEQTGKSDPRDQLNCGTCGYATCREQAIAVLRNMADVDMCVSYMRKLAEQRTDKIIETSPNGIVILDMSLSILHMNSSFRRLFHCSDAVVGKPISYLMDAGPFEKIAQGRQPIFQETVHQQKYSLFCHQIIYALEQDRQIVGLFVDLTSAVRDKRRYSRLQSQTVEQARELLDQMTEMAGKMAEYLGSSTGKSEKLLANLMKIAQDCSLENENRTDQWLKDIYTAK